MLNIVKSLIVVFALLAMTAGATRAVFTSQASVAGNTFATGTLEIRVNNGSAVTGLNFDKAAPGDVVTKSFTLQNYGPPWYSAGASTLAAKEIIPAVANISGDPDLFNALQARLYANAGWSGCSNSATNPFVFKKGCTVYNGPLSGLTGTSSQDVLHATQWGAQASLEAGNSLSMILEVELPVTAGDDLQSKSTSFDLTMTAYNPHR